MLHTFCWHENVLPQIWKTIKNNNNNKKKLRLFLQQKCLFFKCVHELREFFLLWQDEEWNWMREKKSSFWNVGLVSLQGRHQAQWSRIFIRESGSGGPRPFGSLQNNEEARVVTWPPWRPALPVWRFDGLGGWHGPWVTWTLGVPLPVYLPFSGQKAERTLAQPTSLCVSQILCGLSYLIYFKTNFPGKMSRDFTANGALRQLTFSLPVPLNCDPHTKVCADP